MKSRLPSVAALLVASSLSSNASAALVGYWKFDEGTGTVANDFSPNANTGNLIIAGGLPSWQINGGNTGAVGDHALLFGSANAPRVQVNTSPSLNTLNSTNQFTFATWAFESSNTNYGHIFVTTTNFAQRNWLFQTDNSSGGDQSYVWSDTNSAWQKPLGSTIPNNQWIHLALTYDGTTMRYYKNAALVNTIAVNSTFPSFLELDLGGWRAGNSQFGGKLDDMAVFNSVEDIALIMNGTHPAFQAALPVPEPASLSLIAIGGLALLRRRRLA